MLLVHAFTAKKAGKLQLKAAMSLLLLGLARSKQGPQFIVGPVLGIYTRSRQPGLKNVRVELNSNSARTGCKEYEAVQGPFGPPHSGCNSKPRDAMPYTYCNILPFNGTDGDEGERAPADERCITAAGASDEDRGG